MVEEKTGEKLPDVFLSLTAGKTRLTSKTDAQGYSKFSDLKAQKYYLTAILKEY